MWRESVDQFLSNPDPKTVLLIAVAIASTLLFFGQKTKAIDNIPVLGDYFYFKYFFLDSYKVVREGYRLYSKNEKTWAIKMPDGALAYVMPPCVWDEVKALPQSKASFIGAVEENFSWSLHGDIMDSKHIDAVRYGLNENLSRMTDFLVRQTNVAFETTLGHVNSSEWKPVNTWNLFWKITHTIGAAVTTGEPFSRNEPYIYHLQKYCDLVPLLTLCYFAVPRVLRRPLVWWMSPVGILIRYHLGKLRDILIPAIKSRQAMLDGPDAGKKRDFVFIDALLARRAARGPVEIGHTIEELVFMAFEQGPVAAILTQMLFELLANTAYIAPLREEVEEALRMGGGWTDKALERMPKLESFMREAVRLHNPVSFTMSRKVIETVPLSNGFTLRPGMIITAPSLAANTDEDVYKNAETFEGYRFYDAATNTVTCGAGTTNNNFLSYGAGKQVCPGRFFAIKVVKMVFGRLLIEYDMKFANGATERPRNSAAMWQILPDTSLAISFKRRKVLDAGS